MGCAAATSPAPQRVSVTCGPCAENSADTIHAFGRAAAILRVLIVTPSRVPSGQVERLNGPRTRRGASDRSRDRPIHRYPTPRVCSRFVPYWIDDKTIGPSARPQTNTILSIRGRRTVFVVRDYGLSCSNAGPSTTIIATLQCRLKRFLARSKRCSTSHPHCDYIYFIFCLFMTDRVHRTFCFCTVEQRQQGTNPSERPKNK